MSTFVVAGAGPMLIVFMSLVWPEYMGPLWREVPGRILLLVAALLQLVGLVWVYRLLRPAY